MSTFAASAAVIGGPLEATCHACGSKIPKIHTSSRNVPTNNARVLATPREAEAVPTGTVELGFCPGCGFVENVSFDASLVRYDASYEEQQGYSDAFTTFSEALAADLVDRWQLRNKRIVEIGCGKGDFLTRLCELGGNVGVGFDPTAAPARLTPEQAERVKLVQAFYGPRTGMLHADALICRHTLEHVAGVALLLRSLRHSLSASPDVRIFFEVPDVSRVLREGAFWDVYYEHCSYFTAGSLARLFRREGYVVDRLRYGFQDQYLLLEARLAGRLVEATPLAIEESVDATAAALDAYVERSRRSIAEWQQLVRSFTEAGKRVAIWGSGSKCVSFLAETGLEQQIERIVDVNPHRHGRYLPRTASRIDAPSVLRSSPVDLVIAMNPVYEGEIRAELDRMGVSPELRSV